MDSSLDYTKYSAFEFEPISRSQLALFACGSGDHNPIHIDIDIARAAGMKDVFAQGMLVMALMGRAISNWVGQSNILEFTSRFVSMTQVGDRLKCKVVKYELVADTAILDLEVVNSSGEKRVTGSAKIKLQGD